MPARGIAWRQTPVPFAAMLSVSRNESAFWSLFIGTYGDCRSRDE
jgi:hypothetical protein